MIPAITIRADNAFGLPLLVEYARALRVNADEYPELGDRLRARAAEIDAMALAFQAWGDLNPDKVKPDRTVTPADPGTAAHEARRRYRERSLAHDRDVSELRAALEAARRDLQHAHEERDKISAALARARPMIHAAPRADVVDSTAVVTPSPPTMRPTLP